MVWIGTGHHSFSKTSDNDKLRQLALKHNLMVNTGLTYGPFVDGTVTKWIGQDSLRVVNKIAPHVILGLTHQDHLPFDGMLQQHFDPKVTNPAHIPFVANRMASYANEATYTRILNDPVALESLVTKLITLAGSRLKAHALLLHSPTGLSVLPSCSAGDRLAWTVLTHLKARGIVEQIGVSNFTQTELQSIKDIAKPTYNQIEFNLTHQRKDLVNYCHRQGIQVVAYLLFQWNSKIRNSRNPRIDQFCRKYNLSIGTVMAALCKKKDIIPIILPQTYEHLQQVVQCTFEFSQAQLKHLESLDLKSCTHHSYGVYDIPIILGPFWDWHLRSMINTMDALKAEFKNPKFLSETIKFLSGNKNID